MSYPSYQVPAGDVLPVMFSSYAGATGASVTLTGLAVTDIEIYKDGSVTQRASDAGYTLLDTDGIDFDGITGIHGFSIDTGDNTDASFYTVGAWFTVVVSAVTVDSQTVNFIACQFRIMAAEAIAGKPKADVDGWLGTACATPTVAGVPEVDLTHVAGATTNVSALATNVDAILTDTAVIGATGGGLTSLATQASVNTIDDFLDTEIAAIITTLGTPAGASISADLVVIDNFVDGIESTLASGVTVTTNNDKTGYSLATTGLDAIASTATGMVEIAKAIWDRVLSAANHNVASSAGRRLRTLQTGGNYEGGMVWVDTVNGVAGTTVDENGVVTNPVSTWADALTLSAAIPLKAFHIANGSTVTLTSASSNYTLEGHEWTLALGGQAVAATMVINGSVSGTGTGGNTEFEDCIFGITSLAGMQAYNCSFTATTSGGFTMSTAGDYRFINCQSGVAGSGAPLFTLGTGAVTAEFRRWSGGIQVAGISSDDTLTIGGELGTVTLGGADGTVEIRGSYKAIVDNRTGSPTLNLDGAFKAADVASILVDTAEIGSAGAGLTSLASAANLATVAGYLDTEIAAILADTNELQTDWANGGRLDLILDAASAPTAAAVADAVWDEVLSGHLTAGTTGNALNAAGSAGDPWSTAIPGAYGAGTAGKILGDNINATISSRASQTSLDTVDDLLDTEIAALTTAVADLPTNAELATALGTADDAVLAQVALVKADTAAILIDTAEIGAAGAGLTALATQTSVNTIDDLLDTEVAAILAAVDTEVAAIKAKTDLIPAAPAAVGDVPTTAQIATAVLTTQMTESYRADGAAPTLAQAQCETLAHLGETAIAGITKTIKKFDGTTTAETFTLDSATTPTSITRST